MGRTILDEKTANLLLLRANTLSAASSGAWGNMNVTDMLYHCSTINSAVLAGKNREEKSTLKQKLLKTLVLRILRQLPKGVKTNPKFLRPASETTAFDKEQARFKEALLRLASHPDPIAGKHPFFGPLNTKEWRRFLWMHTDHHLRQFGV